MSALSTQIDASNVPGFNAAATNAEKAAIVQAFLLGEPEDQPEPPFA